MLLCHQVCLCCRCLIDPLAVRHVRLCVLLQGTLHARATSSYDGNGPWTMKQMTLQGTVLKHTMLARNVRGHSFDRVSGLHIQSFAAGLWIRAEAW